MTSIGLNNESNFAHVRAGLDRMQRLIGRAQLLIDMVQGNDWLSTQVEFGTDDADHTITLHIGGSTDALRKVKSQLKYEGYYYDCGNIFIKLHVNSIRAS
jgi:hypothetical protein